MEIYSAFDLILVTFSNHWGDLTRPKYVESDLSGFHLSSLLSSLLSILPKPPHWTLIQCNPKLSKMPQTHQTKGLHVISFDRLSNWIKSHWIRVYISYSILPIERNTPNRIVVSLSVELVLEDVIQDWIILLIYLYQYERRICSYCWWSISQSYTTILHCQIDHPKVNAGFSYAQFVSTVLC